MSSYWRAKKPASEMTIEEWVQAQIIAGVMSNRLVNGALPPQVIVQYCKGVADEFFDVHYGNRGGKTGDVVAGDYRKSQEED